MNEGRSLRRRFADATAAWMFWLSLLFLANVATLIVVWVHIPHFRDAEVAPANYAEVNLPELTGEKEIRGVANALGLLSLRVTEFLWPIFLLEFAFYALVPGEGPRFTRSSLLSCICPPLRLAAANPERNEQLWLPGVGWTDANDEIRERLQKVFGIPMIVIALMILPVLLVEFGLHDQLNQRPWLRAVLHISTGVIWFAFAVEFILMYSVAPKKLRYCKDHWIDLAIILLPLISFLRSLRLVRATRLAKLAKVQHLAKMGRVYRLRGLVIKALRALLLFEVLDRLLPISPERRVESLREQLEERRAEVADLEQRIAILEQQIEQAECPQETP